MNRVVLVLALGGPALGLLAVAGAWYFFSPEFTDVGYAPEQPIAYSHELHVGELGLDCRYCHSFVDVSGHSNVPTGNTCWNCHQHVQKDSPKLAPLHVSMNPSYPGYDGKPIEWVRIHKAPDYVYFNHSAHVNRGISCQSCHGEVNKMEVVYQAESHSMGWCLDCHRAPEEHLRPLEEVYNLNYSDSDVAKYVKNSDESILTTKDLGKKLKDTFNVHPKTSCATCHR